MHMRAATKSGNIHTRAATVMHPKAAKDLSLEWWMDRGTAIGAVVLGRTTFRQRLALAFVATSHPELELNGLDRKSVV